MPEILLWMTCIAWNHRSLMGRQGYGDLIGLGVSLRNGNNRLPNKSRVPKLDWRVHYPHQQFWCRGSSKYPLVSH